MDDLKKNLDILNDEIKRLSLQIENEKIIAENNIKPLTCELNQVKEDKRKFALKNDFDSIQSCRRREENLKFKINAYWNNYSILKNDLVKLNNQKTALEYEIKLEEDRVRRNNELLAKMDVVLDNYRKTHDLKQAAVDSNINPDYVQQWFEWGENNFNETYNSFYNGVVDIDSYFKKLESEELRNQMDRVVDAYCESGSLEDACEMVGVGYDTVMYWYEWGLRGFGEDNVYFYNRIFSLKK
ncbi:MAG: hypothetical protein E7Z80_07810 [Methanobrevibacter thaueri]|nr:hypothetical protein [Methanobrevibacter thaueri]